VTLYMPSNRRYENTAQERLNERKAEEKQTQRLLAILARKLGPRDEKRRPSASTHAA
jgi:hypothetical protein